MAVNNVEYMCSYCGKKVVKNIKSGRPDPGTCPRKGKTKTGKTSPHSWRVNRKF